MLRKIQVAAMAALLLFAVGCSDSGDNGGTNPTTGPSLSVNDRTASEGSTLNFTVTLSPAADQDVVFDYTTTDGSAIAGQDYTAVVGKDTLLAGATSLSIPVVTTDDAIGETSETFTVVLSAAVNASIGDGTGTGTILDNDGGAPVSFSASIQPLVASRCAISGCHGSGSTNGGMTFGTASYSEVRNASGDHGAIIVPGNALASNMYLKTTSSPPFGLRMPASGGFLSTDQQNLIRDWIDQGAQNN